MIIIGQGSLVIDGYHRLDALQALLRDMDPMARPQVIVSFAFRKDVVPLTQSYGAGCCGQ